MMDQKKAAFSIQESVWKKWNHHTEKRMPGRKVLFVIIGLLTFCLSCGKDDDMSLEFRGVVMDFFTKQTYPDTRVILETGTGIDVLNGYEFSGSQIDSVRTNSKGLYSFFKDTLNRNIYRLEVKKQGYLQVLNPAILARTVQPDLNIDTLMVGQAAKLIIQAFNNNPGDGDEVSVTIHYDYPASMIENHEQITHDILLSEGLNPDNFSIERDYFYDLNHTVRIDIRTMRIVQGDPVYTNQSLEVELSPAKIKVVTYEF